MSQPAAIRLRTICGRRAIGLGLAVVACLAVFLVAAQSHAQDKAESAAPATPPAPTSSTAPEAEKADGSENTRRHIRELSGRIQYVGPDTYILLDEQGRPQPVPGMTYEDFLNAWKKTSQSPQPDSTPRFVIENIEFTGTTRDGFAELDFHATVRLWIDGRVEVPLGLMGAILRGEPTFEAVGDQTPPKNGESGEKAAEEQTARDDYLTQSTEEGGVVARLDGRKGERRRVSLQLIVPLSRDGAEATLQLSCPRAVSSNLILTTRQPVTDANVSSGTLIEQQAVPEGGTRLHVAGPVGPFRLTWHSSENASAQIATVLSSTGAIRVSIDGRSVRSEARLRVQSYGGGFDRLRVRLPPGAQLLPDSAVDTTAQRPKYRVSVEPATAAAPGTPGTGQIVLVEFPKKQLAPVTIDLATEQPIGLKDESLAVELAGFEVLGAVRQFGDVALQVADDWQARWQVGAHVRQVDTEELEAALQQPGLAAAFQYDRQPWSLGVRIETRQTRIHVTPQYDLQCWPDEARLTLRLNYQIYGARAFEFQVRMKGWQITGSPLESGGLVDLDKILRGADDTLTLPLSQASTPRAEITLSLRFPLSRERPRIELPLPVPIAASIGTGDLTVRATPEFELQPNLQDSVGLVPVAMADSVDAANANGASLHFRSVLPDAVLIADRLSRAQRVSADSVAQVELSAASASVDQQFDYDVEHVPAKELLFETSNELRLDGSQIVAVLVTAGADGESNAKGEIPLTIADAPAELETPGSTVARRFRVSLPQPRLGQFTVRVRYQVPRPDGANAGAAWRLPLILPLDSQEVRLRALLRVPQGLTVALDPKAVDSTWKTATAPEIEQSGSGYAFVADGAATALPLIVTASDFNLPSATTVDRIWLQSWFSGGIRQDRAAIRFRTASSQATVELPPQSSASEIEVLLDGKPADVLSRDRGRIEVRLAGSTKDQAAEAKVAEHTLELRFRQPVRSALLTYHRLTPPMLVGGRTLSQVYWQIILPGDEHIIRSPRGLSSASRWQWLGSFLGRTAALSQPELEKWAGASTQVEPAISQNEYLYTGLAPVLSIELVTAPRWLVVLGASSMVLAIALLWSYVPAARRGWILLAIACSIAAVAVVFPVPALLLAQAAVLGVVASLLALFLKRATARPVRWPVTTSAGSSQRPSSPRPESVLIPPAMSGASTAPAVPLRLSDSQL